MRVRGCATKTITNPVQMKILQLHKQDLKTSSDVALQINKLIHTLKSLSE